MRTLFVYCVIIMVNHLLSLCCLAFDSYACELRDHILYTGQSNGHILHYKVLQLLLKMLFDIIFGTHIKTHTHIHVRTHTRTHTYTCTHTHTHTCTYTHTHMYTHTLSKMFSCWSGRCVSMATLHQAKHYNY